VVDLRFFDKRTFPAAEGKGGNWYKFSVQQIDTMLGSLGRYGAQNAGYLLGKEKHLPNPLQRFAPLPYMGNVGMMKVDKLIEPWGVKTNPIKQAQDQGETDADFALRKKAVEDYVMTELPASIEIWKSQKAAVTDVMVMDEISSLATKATNDFRKEKPLPGKKRPVKKTIILGK
jgi:hypothetical protein